MFVGKRSFFVFVCLCFGMLVQNLIAVEKKIKITDFSGRGFAPDLVQYKLDINKNLLASLRLLDDKKNQMPVQFSQNASNSSITMSFVAEVLPDGTSVYTLDNKGKPAAKPAINIQKKSKIIEISNNLLSIKVPSVQKTEYKLPVSASTLPAPILGFKSGKSVWLGKSKILTEHKVKSFSVELREKGPVYAEVVYQINWAEGGFYKATMQVIDRVPIVKIREEFDLKKLDGKDFWELQLAANWSPDRMETARTYANGSGVDKGSNKPLLQLSKMKNVRIIPDNIAFSISYIGIFNKAEKTKNPNQYQMAGFVPLHKGDWRKMNVVPVKSKGINDVRLMLSMSARDANWIDDVGSETSPFSMQEHDPELPRTYGRRVWGLVLAAPKLENSKKSTVRFTYFRAPQKLSLLGPFAQVRSFYGTVGLNRYKNFILEWNNQQTKYPKLYNNIAKDPNIADASGKSLTSLLTELKGLCNAPISCSTISHHLMISSYVNAAHADAVLANKKLSPELRKLITSRLALIMYLFEDPDFISYGNGAHTGNPNMGTCRYMGANAFLPLLENHPMFKTWRKHVAGYTEYKMASQIAPGGSYLEFGSSYHMHGYARTTNSLPGLLAAGAANIKKLYQYYHKPDWDYFMNLLTPKDPRYGSRIIPGLANAGPGQVGHFLEAAGSFVKLYPEFAANLKWAWEANGSGRVKNPWIMPKKLKPVKPQLTSRIFPGFGVVFRAHQGDDETYMLIRSGFDWSHWYIDQGHIVIMSRGSVLLPYQPYAYWSANVKKKSKNFDYYNLLRFGETSNEFPYDWPDGNVLDHTFGKSVDYAWISTGIPDWFINPSINPKLKNRLPANVVTGQLRKLDSKFKQKEGAFDWNRQIMFMKGKTANSPNYFVIRDSMQGDGQLSNYFFLNLLGTEKNIIIKNNDIHLNTEWPVEADIIFPDRKKLNPEFYSEKEKLDMHNIVSKNPVKIRDWFDIKGNPMPKELVKSRGYAKSGLEQHTILRLTGKPGSGYTWIVYPRKKTEAMPKVSSPAEGVVNVQHPEGNDYIFISTSQLKYSKNNIIFEGKSGSIRINDKTVTLILTGGAGKIGYKGCIYNAVAPFEKVIPISKLSQEEKTHPANKTAIKLPVREKNSKEIAPGVFLNEKNKISKYFVTGKVVSVVYADKNITVDARNAYIEKTPEYIRFITPDTTYVKLTVGNTGVRGIGPFDLTFRKNKITGKVEGKTRTIVTTWPENIVRPMFKLDNIRYFAGWADDHCVSKDTKAPQFAIAFGVLNGKHNVLIDEWTFPPLPAKIEDKTVNFLK